MRNLSPVPLSLFLVLLVCPALLAQDSTPASEVLTNDKVITMVRAGLPSSVIVNKLRTSQTNFNTSTDELIRLKQEKVPDEEYGFLPPGALTQASGAATLGKMYTFGVAQVK